MAATRPARACATARRSSALASRRTSTGRVRLRVRTTATPTWSRTTRSHSSATSSAGRTKADQARAARLGPMQEHGAEQRALFRRWPAGVSIVVAEVDGRRAGLTVSSLVSLSLEPRLVGISIALQASLHEVLRDAGEWAVSILAGDQDRLAHHFAR